MTVTLEYAETHLGDLLAKAGAGEEVVITGNETTRVRLVAEPAVAEVTVLPQRQLGTMRAGLVERSMDEGTVLPQRVAGTMRHTLILPENWEEDWKRMGEELTEIMENGSVYPPFPLVSEER